MARNSKVQPIGLDIGHSSIKMIQLGVAEDQVKVLAAECAAIDADLPDEGDERRHAIVLTIKQLLERGNFRGRNVVSALSGDNLRITSLRLAEAETLHIDKTLRKEAALRFGLDPRRDTINYMLAGSVRQGDEVKSEFILFAADDETIKSHIGLLEQAGLRLVGIDAAPCALFRTLERVMRREEDREPTIIFIDVGCRETTVVFGRAGEICFAKQMPLGTSRFNEAIAAKLDIPVSDAEVLRVKLQKGESMEASTHRLIIDALNAAAEKLAREIALCLRYYTVTFRGKRVERTVIAGGGARETVLRDVLRRHLSVEIEVAKPLKGFDLSGVTLSDDDGLTELTLAVGLSLKGWDVSASGRGERKAESMTVLEGA